MSLNLEDIINQVKAVEETKIQKEKGGYKGDPRILKFKKNCTYVLRLIPYIKDVNNTFVTYKEVGFKSPVDGTYVYGGRSPQDAGIKEDLFKKTQWDHYSKAKERGDEVEQKASYKLLAQRKQAVNAYLVSVEGDDPDAKEKIGDVVAIPYPAQVDREGVPISDIYKKIHSAIFGDMSKKIGAKALDLSEKGRSLIVKVTEKAGYNNYSETTFDDAEDLGLSESQIREILNSAHDLSEFIPEVKPQDEIQKILDKHWFGTSASPDDELEEEEEEEEEEEVTVSPKKKIDLTTKPEDDEIPMGKSKSDDLDDLDALLTED
jgi:hypothetical protein